MPSGRFFRLNLHGPFGLSDAEQTEIVITSKKSKALLAILASSPHGTRSRSWLQSVLWGRCERREAQGSLRRELSNLRKCIGLGSSDLLVANASHVRLNLALCEKVSAVGPELVAGEFLEGIDLRGEKRFEDWLRTIRTEVCASQADATSECRESFVDSRIFVGVLRSYPTDGSGEEPELCNEVLDRIVECMAESGCVATFDARLCLPSTSLIEFKPDFLISCRACRYGPLGRINIRISDPITGGILISSTSEVETEKGDAPDATDLDRLAREFVDRFFHAVSHNQALSRPAKHAVVRGALCAIEQMFNLSPECLANAERMLDAALRVNPQSAIFAWRAYCTVFHMDQISWANYQAVREVAEENSHRALELDPYNALSLSLLTHVQSFVLRDFIRASDLLERAKSLNSNHVMTYDADAMLSLYTGDLSRARASAARAELLGRHLPFRYCFATSKCMIDALSGDLEAAIRHGERAISLQSSYTRKSYAPTLRYLGASYSAAKRYHEAENVFRRLNTVDARLCSSDVDMQIFPAPAKTAANFIREGLRAVSM